jgi:hypothetical protein
MNLVYDLYRNGHKLGQVTDTFVRNGNRYTLTSETRATGPLKMLWPGNIRLESTGVVTPQGLRPTQFQHARSDAPHKLATARLDWKQRSIAYQYKGESWQVNGLQDGAQDQLSQLYQFMFVPPARRYSLQVVSGRDLNDYRYARSDGGALQTPLGDPAQRHPACGYQRHRADGVRTTPDDKDWRGRCCHRAGSPPRTRTTICRCRSTAGKAGGAAAPQPVPPPNRSPSEAKRRAEPLVASEQVAPESPACVDAPAPAEPAAAAYRHELPGALRHRPRRADAGMGQRRRALHDHQRGRRHRARRRVLQRTLRADQPSLFFQLALTAPPPEGQLAFTVFNGKKLRHYAYEVRGEETLDTALGVLRTLHLARTADSDGRFEVWLAIDRHYLPVRMLRSDDKGGEMELVLLSIAP